MQDPGGGRGDTSYVTLVPTAPSTQLQAGAREPHPWGEGLQDCSTLPLQPALAQPRKGGAHPTGMSRAAITRQVTWFLCAAPVPLAIARLSQEPKGREWVDAKPPLSPPEEAAPFPS